jgi:hypothetical protein
MLSSASGVSPFITTKVLHPLILVQIRAQCLCAIRQRNFVSVLGAFTVSELNDSRLGDL